MSHECCGCVETIQDCYEFYFTKCQELEARIKELEDMNAHLKKCLAIFSDPLLAKIDEEAQP